MNRKTIAALSLLLLLSGCGTVSATEGSTSEAADSVAESACEGGYYVGECIPSEPRDFVSAVSGPKGKIDINDPINLNFYVGRPNDDKYYEEYANCTFYIDEWLAFEYCDKRGEQYSTSRRYTRAAKYPLPDLMDEKFRVKENADHSFQLTEHIPLTIDLKGYKDKFTNVPEAVCKDSESEDYKKEIKIDLDHIKLYISLRINAINDQEDDENEDHYIWQAHVNYPMVTYSNDEYQLSYEEWDTGYVNEIDIEY